MIVANADVVEINSQGTELRRFKHGAIESYITHAALCGDHLFIRHTVRGNLWVYELSSNTSAPTSQMVGDAGYWCQLFGLAATANGAFAARFESFATIHRENKKNIWTYSFPGVSGGRSVRSVAVMEFAVQQ